MPPVTLEPVLSWILALCCAVLLTWAAVHKLAQWRDFISVVDNYRIVHARLVSSAAAIVTTSELSASLLLLPPVTRPYGALAAALLFAAYAGVIALNLLRGRTSIDCGCATASKRRRIGAWMVWRNVVLAAAASLAAVPMSARNLSAPDVLSICASVTALALLYAAFDQLAATTSKTGLAS
jgi:hypothetical protein